METEALFIFIVLSLFGLVIGSFLSVCIYRIPLSRIETEIEGVEHPESHLKSEADITFNSPKRSLCPHCKAQLKWFHNIPLLSWLMQGGKCVFCKARISIRYPIVELLSLATMLLSYGLYGLTPTAATVYLFCCALIVITFIDYDYFIIPNVITLPGSGIAAAIAVTNHFTGYFSAPVVATIWESLFGLLFGGGFLLFISEVYLRLRKIEGLGMGDVKLLAMTGLLFGPECAIYTIFIGSLFGSFFGLALVALRGRSMSQHIPFGPYLAFGTVLYLFTGNLLLELLGKVVSSWFNG